MIVKSVPGILLAVLLPLGQAHALLLGTWNDADLDASGDAIIVDTGLIANSSGGNDTWFSLQWQAGTANSLTAIGIDTIFYNCDGCNTTNKKKDDSTSFGGVNAVWEGAIGSGTDVTAEWTANFGGDNSGGGFGSFSSRKSQEPGGTAGIAPDLLFFILNGDVNFINNGSPTFSTFSVHVRYEENCSGWASDGNTKEASTGSCSTSVPSPTAVWLIGLGLVLFGLAHRRA